MIVSEVPLLFASVDAECPLCVLEDDGEVEIMESSTKRNDVVDWNGCDALVGSASISHLSDNSFVATLPHESVLCVMRVQNSSTQRIEIDLSGQLEANVIAKVGCFIDSNESLILIIADARANIYSILIEKESFKPLRYKKISVEKLLDDKNVEYSGAELHNTMVEFISHSIAIIALSPLILTLDLQDPSIYLWSESQVKDAMSSSIGSILGRAGSLLLGRMEQHDTAPVSALSFTQGWIFTLHADAKIRQWKLNLYGYPEQVFLIPFQLPDNWTTVLSPNAFCITAQTYGEKVSAVVHIHTRHEGATLHLIQTNHDGSYPAITPLILPDDISCILSLCLQPGKAPRLFVVASEDQDNIPMKRFSYLLYSTSRSGLDPTPLVLPINFTLDGIAEGEHKRVSSLNEKDIHHIDTLFLRHIFRPVYPRGTGMISGPTRATMKAAIAQHMNRTKNGNGSLELETLKAVHQWRLSEELYSSKRRTPYNCDLTQDPKIDEENSLETDDIVGHLCRWRALLNSIHQHEAKLREPLNIACLPDGKLILMRVEVLSFLQEDEHNTGMTEFDRLDELALHCLQKVENEKLDRLNTIEAGFLEIVTSCSLVLYDEPDCRMLANEMQNLGLWAQSGSFVTAQGLLKSITSEKIREYLDTAPKEVLFPGLSQFLVPTSLAPQGELADIDLRKAAAGLVVRGVDAMRRLIIGRCLFLLVHFKENSVVQNMALTKYLHVIAVQWSWSQHVSALNMPRSPIANEMPRKRLSFRLTDENHFRSKSSQKYNVLDLFLSQVSRALPSELSLHELIMVLAKTVLESAFRRQRDSGSPFQRLPELGCLPAPSNLDIPSDFPRLALRLLSATSLLPSSTYDAKIARTEAIAECLLIEANNNMDLSRLMRDRASLLLDPTELQDDSEPYDIAAAYQALVSSAKGLAQSIEIGEADHQMMREIQRILYGYVDNEIQQDIRRLCEKTTMRLAFSPYFLAGGLPRMNNEQNQSVIALIHALLRMSNLLHRLMIIERHTDSLGLLSKEDFSLNLVDQTDRTIREIEEIFPETMYKEMSEYFELWSLLFRHAVAASDWTTAIDACLKNPSIELKKRNFEQLVNGMVNTGALEKLLQFCISVKDVDLYEIAADVLSQSNDIARFYSRGLSVDYLGCLYSLHAFSGDWKRAAQAMELRFGDAKELLSCDIESVDTTLAVRVIALSSTAASIVIQLVPDLADSFLVAGEFGPYPSIMILDEELDFSQKSILKKPRASTKQLYKDDRLSRFMTAIELRAQALRSIAFQTITLDDAARMLSTSALSRPSLSDDVKTINCLASSGHLALAFVIAKVRSMCYAAKRGDDAPHENHILYTLYTNLVCDHLVGIAISQNNKGSNYDGEMETDNFPPNRTTLSQLQLSLDYLYWCSPTSYSFVFEPRGSSAHISKGNWSSTAMELIRLIVLKHDSAGCPMALQVASAFLRKSDAQLPFWLESHLLGELEPGLFAKTVNGTSSANAPALCTLYMQHGRYVDACNLVTRVLTGNDSDGKARKAMSVNSIPEKGNVLFVPYYKIDILWNLVDQILRQGGFDEAIMSELRVCRMKMEEALRMHFRLVKISEEGLRSARALAI